MEALPIQEQVHGVCKPIPAPPVTPEEAVVLRESLSAYSPAEDSHCFSNCPLSLVSLWPARDSHPPRQAEVRKKELDRDGDNGDSVRREQGSSQVHGTETQAYG